jgi:hypothetical protein
MSQAIEPPGYEVLHLLGDSVEVRRYAPSVVADVVVAGPASEADKRAFPIPAGYLFGKNKGERKFAMTATRRFDELGGRADARALQRAVDAVVPAPQRGLAGAALRLRYAGLCTLAHRRPQATNPDLAFALTGVAHADLSHRPLAAPAVRHAGMQPLGHRASRECHRPCIALLRPSRLGPAARGVVTQQQEPDMSSRFVGYAAFAVLTLCLGAYSGMSTRANTIGPGSAAGDVICKPAGPATK